MSNQKHLWAPWKMDYLENKKGDSQKIFLDKANESNDRENLILHRSNNCYVIMNYYPYNNGHLMVVPYNEVDRFEDLEDATLSEIIILSKKIMKILRANFNCDGFNFGSNPAFFENGNVFHAIASLGTHGLESHVNGLD